MVFFLLLWFFPAMDPQPLIEAKWLALRLASETQKEETSFSRGLGRHIDDDCAKNEADEGRRRSRVSSGTLTSFESTSSSLCASTHAKKMNAGRTTLAVFQISPGQ